VHANREALAACLAHARRQGYDRALFLGDLVGYCADRPGCSTRSCGWSGGAVAVLGNHDDAVVRGPQATMEEDAAAAALWTAARLDAAHLAFLAGLPPTIESGELLLVHANAWAPRRWEYLTSAAAAARSLAATVHRLTFFGHVHAPALYHLGAAGGVGTFTPDPEVEIPLSAAALGGQSRLGGTAARRHPRRVLRHLRRQEPSPRVPPGTVRRRCDREEDPRRRPAGALRGAAGSGA